MDTTYTWFTTFQASRVLILLLNIQTNPLLAKIPGKRVTTMLSIGSLSDFSRIENARLYSFEGYNDIDMSDDIVSMNVIGNRVNDFAIFYLIPSMLLATTHMFQEVQKIS